MLTLAEITSLVDAGQADEAAAALRATIAARQDEPGGHGDEARLAERLGLSSAGVRAWQLALRDDPNDAAAWTALATLHAERGERERAEACQRQLAKLGVTVHDTPVSTEEPEAPGPTDADLVRFVHLFAGREDTHARMWRDDRGVGYSPVPGPLTPELARAHLHGALTLGAYLIRHDDTVGYFVLDLDITRAALSAAAGDRAALEGLRQAAAAEGLRLLQALRGLGLAPLLEDSGQKGRHLWCFLPEPRPAAEVLAFGARLCAALAPRNTMLHLEFFPKQPRVEVGGVGSLVKLPLGLHLGSRRWSRLLDDAGEPIGDPHLALRAVERRPLPPLHSLPEALPLPSPATSPPVVAAADRPWVEADFESHPEVGVVLAGCAVLRQIVSAALTDRQLSREAAVVLEHTLGHSPAGVRAVNYLFERIPGFPAGQRLGAPHRGQPTSCSKVRSRVPEIAGVVSCACPFPERPGQYRHPLRHLDDPPPRVEPAPTLDERLAAYGRALDRLRTVSAETVALRSGALAALREIPGRRWAAPGGEWRVEGEGADEVLSWAPAPGEP